MKKKNENKGRKGIKIGLKLLASACVDAFVCGGTAAVVPVTMINPVLGVMIVIGGAVATSAMCDACIDGYVEKTVDEVADKINEQKKEVQNRVEDIKICKEAEEIAKTKGYKAGENYLRNRGFKPEQIESVLKKYKQKDSGQ